MATPRPITFLSDYGYEDEFAGVCRAVIAQIAPGAPLIDLTPRDRPPRRPPGRDRCSPTRCPPARRASTWRWSIPASARRGARSRSPRPRDASSSAPTTACSPARSTASAGRSRRSSSRARPSASSRSRRPSTAATCSRRWPRTSSLGARLEEAGQSIDPGLAGHARPAHPRDRRRSRSSPTRSTWTATATSPSTSTPRCSPTGRCVPGMRSRSGRRTAASRRVWARTFADVGPGDVLLFEDSSGALALAVSGGSAARADGPRARRRGHAAAADVTGASGTPHRHFRRTRLDQRARPRAGRGRGARRARSSPPTSRPPGAAAGATRGPRRRARPALLGAPPPARRSATCCCRSPSPLAVCEAAEALAPGRAARSSGRTTSGSTSASSPGVLIEARPRRGLGGDRRRAQPRDRRRASSRRSCATRRSRSARRRPRAGCRPEAPRASGAPSAALNESLGRWLEADDDEVLSAYRARDALCGQADLLGRRRGRRRRRSTSAATSSSSTAGGDRVGLGAGEVHLAVER